MKRCQGSLWVLLAVMVLMVSMCGACVQRRGELVSIQTYVLYDEMAGEVLIVTAGQNTELHTLQPDPSATLRRRFSTDRTRPAFVPFLDYEDDERVIYLPVYAHDESGKATGTRLYRIDAAGEISEPTEYTLREVAETATAFVPIIAPEQYLYFTSAEQGYRLTVTAQRRGDDPWIHNYRFSLAEADAVPDHPVGAEGFHVEQVTDGVTLWLYEEWLESPRFDLEDVRRIIIEDTERICEFLGIELQIPLHIAGSPYGGQLMYYGGEKFTASLGRRPFDWPRSVPDQPIRHTLAHALHWQPLLFEGSHYSTMPGVVAEGIATYFEGGDDPARSSYAFRAYMMDRWTPFDTENADRFLPEGPFDHWLALPIFSYLLEEFGEERVADYITRPRLKGDDWEWENQLTVEMFEMTMEEILREALREPAEFERRYLEKHPADYTVESLEVVFRGLFPAQMYLHAGTGRLAFTGEDRCTLEVIDINTGLKEVLFSAGEDIDMLSMPGWFPDGNRLVVVGFVGGVRNLYVIDLQADEIEQITDTPYAVGGPVVSPCADYIAYRSEKTGDSEIFILELQTGKTRQVTDEGLNMIWPAWNPSGDRLAFLDRYRGQIGVFHAESEKVEWMDMSPHGLEDYRMVAWLSDDEVLVPVRLLGTGYRSSVSVDVNTGGVELWGGFEFGAFLMMPLDAADRTFVATPRLYDRQGWDIRRMIAVVGFEPQAR